MSVLFGRFAAICVAVLSMSAAHALSPADVLVVYGTTPPLDKASFAIARYYAAKRGIPQENLVGLAAPAAEYVTEEVYTSTIAEPLWNRVLSRPEFDRIKAIVLIYGVPSRVITARYTYSLDAALTILDGAGKTTAGLSLRNPYWGRDEEFGSFRVSRVNTIPGGTGGLRYLVCRLDGLDDRTETLDWVAVPTDVKAMIDRSLAARPGGTFLIDRPEPETTPIVSFLRAQRVPARMIVTDTTNVFLTKRPGVMGYFGEHVSKGNANNFTTWGRPMHSWMPGGVALANTNDGQSFRTTKYTWGGLNDNRKQVEPGKLIVIDTRLGAGDARRLNGYGVLLCAANGQRLSGGVFTDGVCAIDLSAVVWPADRRAYVVMANPANAPQRAGERLMDTATPAYPDTSIFEARGTGVSFICSGEKARFQRILEPRKLKVSGMMTSDRPRSSTDVYSGHTAQLIGTVNGKPTVLASGNFEWGTCTIDLSDVRWPDDHKTFVEIHFPANDPLHPGAYVADSRTPASADTSIWESRETGVTFSCNFPSNRLARVVSSAYIAEGASGTICHVMEPYGVQHSPEIVFSRYAAGRTWAEAAYMGIKLLSQQVTVLGDPLMAPFASAPAIAPPAQ